jgi:hypothetical protein
MKKYRVRLAQNTDSDAVAELVDPGSECYPNVLWDDLFPWWVVVMDENRIVGCAQIIASKPVGHIEFLSLHPDLTQTQSAYAIKMIEKFAHVSLYKSGVYVARSSIPETMKQWKKQVVRRWGKFQFTANVYDMRMH